MPPRSSSFSFQLFLFYINSRSLARIEKTALLSQALKNFAHVERRVNRELAYLELLVPGKRFITQIQERST